MSLFSPLRGLVRVFFPGAFPTASETARRELEDETPASERWWAAPSRAASLDEASQSCPQCRQPLQGAPLKECPDCRVALHARCYEKSGGVYQTPGCDTCAARGRGA